MRPKAHDFTMSMMRIFSLIIMIPVLIAGEKVIGKFNSNLTFTGQMNVKRKVEGKSSWF